ncbi:hypothetical protein BLAT2472_60055 [Burkholderia latens]|uniref:hypothetical protein n=1 Tax=Burkholderia latens TaxID=488446 RepID=UPI0039A5D599
MSLFDDVRRAWEDASGKGELGEHNEAVIPGASDEYMVAMPLSDFVALTQTLDSNQRKLDELKTEKSVAWFESQGLTKGLLSHEPGSVEDNLTKNVAGFEATFDEALRNALVHYPERVHGATFSSLYPLVVSRLKEELLRSYTGRPFSDLEGAFYSSATGVKPDLPAHLREGSHTTAVFSASKGSSTHPTQSGALRKQAQRKKHTSGT